MAYGWQPDGTWLDAPYPTAPVPPPPVATTQPTQGPLIGAPNTGMPPPGTPGGPGAQPPLGTTFAPRPAGGWSTQKWNDPSHTSPKYAVGRILAANPNNLEAVLAQIRALNLPGFSGWNFGQANWTGKDTLAIPGGGTFDVLRRRSTGAWEPRWQQVLDAAGNPVGRPGGAPPPKIGPPLTSHPPGSPPMGRMPPGGSPVPTAPPQFTDPATRYLEQLTNSQLQMLEAQRQQMVAETARQQGRRGETEAAVRRLSDFINQRVQTLKGPSEYEDEAKRLTAYLTQRTAELQGPWADEDEAQRLMDYLAQRTTELQEPAYTGTEAEVLRTQALDPIERDRQAARQRALQNIGARGFDPTSGIAQELLNQVDRGFDEQRAGAQGNLAYRQITEERSRQQEAQELLAAQRGLADTLAQGKRGRQQEAQGLLEQQRQIADLIGQDHRNRSQESQQLLQYLSDLPQAAGRGDLEYVTYLNDLVNQPRREALPLASMLSDLPGKRIQESLAVMGTPGVPYPTGMTSGYLQLLQNAQGNRLANQQAMQGYFGGLGRLLGYTFQGQ